MHDKLSRLVELSIKQCLHSLNQDLPGTFCAPPGAWSHRHSSRGDLAPFTGTFSPVPTPDRTHKLGLSSWMFMDESFAKTLAVKELKTDVENLYNYQQS